MWRMVDRTLGTWMVLPPDVRAAAEFLGIYLCLGCGVASDQGSYLVSPQAKVVVLSLTVLGSWRYRMGGSRSFRDKAWK